jgi:hypothetical protein
MMTQTIEERNAAFHKLSNKEKRIAIAKDVLVQIELGKYLATTGIYFYMDFEGSYHKNGANVQEVLLAKNPNCEVCAVGAAFASAARLGNNLFYKESNESDLVAELFGDDAANMEAAFERWDSPCVPEVQNFGRQYPDTTERLKAIFQNIIDNDGSFKP